MPPAPDPAPVTTEDIDDIAMALPEVVSGTSRGGRTAYTVRDRAFVTFREPRPDAIDAETGERMTDVIVIQVPGDADKKALVQSDGPWFTTPHFDGYSAVLVRERDLHLLDYHELAEVITDAWAARAPKKLVKQHLG